MTLGFGYFAAVGVRRLSVWFSAHSRQTARSTPSWVDPEVDSAEETGTLHLASPTSTGTPGFSEHDVDQARHR
jgi:hypothetical protein